MENRIPVFSDAPEECRPTWGKVELKQKSSRNEQGVWSGETEGRRQSRICTACGQAEGVQTIV